MATEMGLRQYDEEVKLIGFTMGGDVAGRQIGECLIGVTFAQWSGLRCKKERAASIKKRVVKKKERGSNSA